MIRNYLLATALYFVSTLIYAQDTVYVLFIGNSYTYVNDLPTMVEDLASSLGDVVFKDSYAAGGATLANHAANPAVYDKINLKPWDFVVLQAQSQEPSFPDAQVDSQTLPYAEQLADSVYANRFCSDVMMFMTWGRENGDPQWAPISTFDGMNSRLRSAYIRMADSVQGCVSAVGSAWKYVRDNYPTIGLYTADGSHPSPEGSYLAACTFYASLFRKTPVGAPYQYTLDAVTAGILQQAAALTVLDSLDFWNLRPISEHTQAEFIYNNFNGTVDFINQSTKAETYQWDFGDGGFSMDENPTYTYSTDGIYTVTLIAESECDSDTITYQISVSIASIGEHNVDNLIVKSLPNNKYQLESTERIQSIRIVSAMGSEISSQTNNDNTILIDLMSLNSGLYIVTVETESGFSSFRLMR